MALAGEGREVLLWQSTCNQRDANHLQLQGDRLCHGKPGGYSGAGLQKH